jgi:tetratricopeptide (TPR) repeat protein
VELLRGWLPKKTLPTTMGTLSIFLTDLGDAQHDTGDLRGAVESYREAVEIRKPMVERDPTALNYRRRLHNLNKHLAEVFGHPFVLNLGNAALAETHATEALIAADRMANEDQGSNRSLQDQAWANWTLGCVLMSTNPRRALPYLEAARELAVKSGNGDVFHDETLAHAEEALGRALLAAGNRQRGLELLRQATVTLERISSRWPQKIDYRFALIRTLNGLGDALPGPEASEPYRKAYLAAEFFPASAGNVRELLSHAEVNLRWPRWNTSATAAERQHKLETALRSWQTLLSYAPNNQSVQMALAEVRRYLARTP